MPVTSNIKSLNQSKTSFGFNSSPLSAVVTTYFMTLFIALICYSIVQLIVIKHSQTGFRIPGLEQCIICNIFPTPDL